MSNLETTMKWWAAVSVLIPSLSFGQPHPGAVHTGKSHVQSTKHHNLPTSTAKPITPMSTTATATGQADLAHAEKLSTPATRPHSQKAPAVKKSSPPVAVHARPQSAQFAYKRPKDIGGVHLGQTKNSPRSSVSLQARKH